MTLLHSQWELYEDNFEIKHTQAIILEKLLNSLDNVILVSVICLIQHCHNLVSVFLIKCIEASSTKM